MPDEQVRTRCQATTRSGTQCKNSAQEGSIYCGAHQVFTDEVPSSNGASQQPPPPTDAEVREQLAEELDRLIEELQESSPEFAPPPFSPQALIATLRQNLGSLPAPMRMDILFRLRETVRADDFDIGTWQGTWYLMHYWQFAQQRAMDSPWGQQAYAALQPWLQKLKGLVNEDLLDLDTWKGLWFMVSYSVQYQVDILKRRMSGDYETDDFGLDREFLDAMLPLLNFMYKYYWRVETSGLENVPDSGRALMVMNHSGQLPFDGAMIFAAIYLEHPAQRLVRSLYANWFPNLPVLSSAFEKIGQTLATEENGVRLLEREELVGVFPEGYKGVSKLYKDRYRLARFGRGGFVRMALKTQAPIIPVAIVGAEETYIALHQSKTLAGLTGFPFFPISLRFPWLGLLGVIPLPTKWYIDIGEPIAMDGYQPDAADDLLLVSQTTDQVRNIVQEMIHQRLARRRSVFLG
jgi:1-acyl-sn-glycerol-3-phosphate acyltransferase